MTLLRHSTGNTMIPMNIPSLLPPFSNVSPNNYPCFNRPFSHRKKFSPEEDKLLTDLVLKFGPKKWSVIAQYLPFRTARQCRDRYSNYLAPGFFNGQWTQEEDDLLYEKYKEIGPKWSQMKDFFKNRSPNSLKNRWNYFISKVYPPINQEKEIKEKPQTEITQKEIPNNPNGPELSEFSYTCDTSDNILDTVYITLDEKENAQNNFIIYNELFLNNQKQNNISTDLQEIYTFPTISQVPIIPLQTEEPMAYDFGRLNFDIGSPIPL